MNPLQESVGDEQDRRTSLLLTGRSTGLNAGEACVTPKIVDPECAELLHGLNNVLVGMLLNAQVLEWKLPSYSRLKRNLHEIERNAQRGGELVKRLLKRFELAHSEQSPGGHNGAEAAAIDPAVIASADKEPDSAVLTEAWELELPGPTATSRLKIGKGASHTCVMPALAPFSQKGTMVMREPTSWSALWTIQNTVPRGRGHDRANRRHCFTG